MVESVKGKGTTRKKYKVTNVQAQQTGDKAEALRKEICVLRKLTRRVMFKGSITSKDMVTLQGENVGPLELGKVRGSKRTVMLRHLRRCANSKKKQIGCLLVMHTTLTGAGL